MLLRAIHLLIGYFQNIRDIIRTARPMSDTQRDCYGTHHINRTICNGIPKSLGKLNRGN